VYYLCESDECHKVKISSRKFDFEIIAGEEAESFRWIAIPDLKKETDLTLPIDTIVVAKLLEE
jgi:hypothetical protein